MDVLGKLRELVKIVFQADDQDITIQPNATTTYTTSTVVNLPDDDSASQEITGNGATQTLTNKTLDDATTLIADTSDVTKTVGFELAGAATSTKTTIAASQTVSRTLTLPDATDTLVGKATTDILTNKTLDDATTVIADNGDVTKTVGFELAGATPSTKTTIAVNQTVNRTLTLPDATDTLVGKATTDTLTNKTLTTPAITSPTGIVKGDVGLGSVDNTSDATKDAATATLTNKTLTTPAITSPTGIVKGDVGLGSADNTSDATKNAATATLTGKTIVASSNTITTAASGNLTSTEINAALAELQTDIDTRGLASAKEDNLPISTRGDLLIRDATNATARLGVGAPAQVITSDGTDVTWENPISGFTDPMTTRGDIIVRNAANATARLALGTEGQVLRPNSSGDPVWEDGVATTTKAGQVTSYANSVQSRIKTSSSAYVILDTDGFDNINIATSTTTDMLVTLPIAANNKGREITIVKTDNTTGNIQVIDSATGSDLINGDASRSLYGQFGCLKVISTGSTWYIMKEWGQLTGSPGGDFNGGTYLMTYSDGVITLSSPAAWTTAAGDGNPNTALIIPSPWRIPDTGNNVYTAPAPGPHLIAILVAGKFEITVRDWAGTAVTTITNFVQPNATWTI